MHRGEIWWAMMGMKTRPIVLVSRDSHVQIRRLILAAPVTTKIKGRQSEVALGLEEGLARPCVANTSSIELISKTRLIRKISDLSIAKLQALDAALRFSLGLD